MTNLINCGTCGYPLAPEERTTLVERNGVMVKPMQEPVAWKFVPTEPTEEMLKAMDECSTEGYDERLYAGHAASVYMAAVDVAPTQPQPKETEQEPVAHFGSAYINENGVHITTVLGPVAIQQDAKLYTTPPQRKPLTDKQVREIAKQYALSLAFPYGGKTTPEMFARSIEAAHGIKEKNT